MAAEPDWTDVGFDPGSAARAVAELTETATAVERAADTVRSDLPVITDDWEGRCRLLFDEDVRRWLAQVDTLAVALVSSARDVDRGLGNAMAEHAGRVEARRRYLEDRDREAAESRSRADASGASGSGAES